VQAGPVWVLFGFGRGFEFDGDHLQDPFLVIVKIEN